MTASRCGTLVKKGKNFADKVGSVTFFLFFDWFLQYLELSNFRWKFRKRTM